MADSRHRKIAEEIWLRYAQVNDLACPWTGKQAKRLDDLLRSLPTWPLEAFLRCVNNRFASEVNRAEDPADWIKKLPSYAGGPLDKFGKPRVRKNEDVIEEYWKSRGSGQY